MRDFFIGWFEKLVAVIIVLMAIGVLIGAVGAISQQGILAGLAILVIGAVYVIFMGGALYLGLGIYQNTKRMADAMERQSG